MPDADIIAETRGADGRAVEIRATTWQHVSATHPEMTNHLNDVIATIESPEILADDPRAGRSRLFRRCGPERWLRVIVEFAGERDRLVTAFPQANDPEAWGR